MPGDLSHRDVGDHEDGDVDQQDDHVPVSVRPMMSSSMSHIIDEDLFAPGPEFVVPLDLAKIGSHSERREGEPVLLVNAPGPGRHDQDPRPQQQRLLDRMRDENDGFLRSRPRA